MPLKSLGRIATLLVALGAVGSTVRADEIVHFTNGAEMAVRSHVVVDEMLKLDLGGNNFISFPILMVDKIVNAGRDVFLNPVYYPSNQALPSASSTVVADTSGRVSAGPPPGQFRQPVPGRNGLRLGESQDVLPSNNFGSGAVSSRGGNPHDDMSTAERPRFDPLRPLAPGGLATIDPPAGGLTQARRSAPMMSPRGQEPPANPTPPTNGQSGQAAPPPAQSGEGSGDAPGTDDSGANDSGSQDPPPTP